MTTIQHLQQTSAVFTNCCINITHRGDINGVHARTCLLLNLTIWCGDIDETLYSEEASFALLRVASEQHYMSALQKRATK